MLHRSTWVDNWTTTDRTECLSKGKRVLYLVLILYIAVMSASETAHQPILSPRHDANNVDDRLKWNHRGELVKGRQEGIADASLI
jgi:hypothetical protein